MPRTVVGLDIGTTGVRAAEFRLARRAPKLRRCAAVPLPRGAVRAGVVVDEAAVSQALRTLWSEGKFSTKDVVIGIANDGVLVRQMDLDWMPPADFRKALHYQVAEALPLPVDEANLDYHLLEEVEAGGATEGETSRVNRILLVAAARDVVDGFVNAAHGAGLRVQKADLLPFALVRAASSLADDAPTEAIVDIGADTISVVVHRGGRPRYVRIIPSVGSDTITQALQERYGWNWEDAERTKVVLGLPTVVDPSDEDGDTPLPHPAQQVITEQAHQLVAEVRATLDFFLDSGPDSESLSRVVLTGAGSQLGGLADLVAAQLDVPVEDLSPMSLTRGRRRRNDSQSTRGHAVTAGLCLGVSAS